jgi:CIC family chloride channel protein
LRINTALRHAAQDSHSGTPLRELASRNFVIVREDDIVFDVIQRIWRQQATMALVTRSQGVPQPGDITGAITKEHVADSVANSTKIYPA